MNQNNIVPLKNLSLRDLARVGGKNASLGELISGLSAAGVQVPGGYATTADAYRRFLKEGGLTDKIQEVLQTLKEDDTRQLAQVGSDIRQWIEEAPLPADIEQDIRAAYAEMCKEYGADTAVAVRSSATAEDLPDSSFAGQQETFLNICGAEALIAAVRKVYASLFTDRAVSYRRHRGYGDEEVALSVTIQRMIRSDCAASGVMFTLDTESGFADVVFITAAYGLGESVVQGAVNPDEFYVYKPALDADRSAIIRRSLGEKADKMIFGEIAEAGASVKMVKTEESDRQRFCISDEDILQLARYARSIEKHYGRHMDIEWAKDGKDGGIYIVQARPETVKSQMQVSQTVTRYRVGAKGSVLAEGRAIGQKIGVGAARVVSGSSDMHTVKEGEILITDMTDPDWEPVMKRAGGIVTRRGGRTCHAAIIARELGVPAVVGCGDTLEGISDGSTVSVCCAEGDTGFIYDGAMEYNIEEIQSEAPPLPIKLQINIANPDSAFDFSTLPVDGVGLARLEFIIARSIGFHPRCALDYATLSEELRQKVRRLSAGYADARECYVGKLSEGIATIAAAFHPREVIVRLSDFKSNEYAGLVGGKRFEPIEENPMIGFRGASRYITERFSDCFALECEALLRVREQIGLDNVWIMAPFVRTVAEADAVIAALLANGIKRPDWKIVMMCEVPSNALLADDFLQRFDGFSIGSNDLTQLTLALDRDSELVANTFDERNPAVKMLISQAISACRAQDKYVGICGQGPSDYPDFAEWLLQEGIKAISLNADAVRETRIALAKIGKKIS
ncbi:MAG: phosphoenolpyruvate synthase [Proteobacteria bacterium]|nr:phosphoenolpyruvate synthase [Pseudomonadota bacterium]